MAYSLIISDIIMQSEKTRVQSSVSLEFSSTGVAFIRLAADESEVVILNEQRLLELKAVLEQFKQQEPKGLIILASGSDMFSVGADIKVIGKVTDPADGAKLARTGQDVFDLIAALKCPTIAAISGPCVGGGCELVLACKYRIISDRKSSIIGLPEVKLGILPGFGGTQRMPRLIGFGAAADLILSGKLLKPQKALIAGLVDQVVPWELLKNRAEDIALGRVKVKRPLKQKLACGISHIPLIRRIIASKAEAVVQSKTKGFYPAPLAALDCMRFGYDQGMIAGLENEAKQLGRLIASPECKALVHVFFMTEAAKGLGKSASKACNGLKTMVVGGGVMGAGIASAFAQSECSVILKDLNKEATDRGLNLISGILKRNRSLSDLQRNEILRRVNSAHSFTESSNVGFAIEAIFEELTAKKKVFADLAAAVSPDCILASNTSSLSVTSIAEGLPNPGRFVGMHFFNPVEKMPLVEVVRAQSTDDRTLVMTAALASKLGKFPIIVEDVPGFLVNRVLVPYLNEAAFLLQEGFAIEDIDRAALDFGLPMGPVRLLDEVGLDIATHVQHSLSTAYGERMTAPRFCETLNNRGRKGKKSGSGFYIYNGKSESVDQSVYGLLDLKTPKRADAQSLKKIQTRLVHALINEAVNCLDQGVAGLPGRQAAQQIDLGTVMGMGFPPFRGGVIYYAESLGASGVYRTLVELETLYGARFSPSVGIRQRAERNLSFYESMDAEQSISSGVKL